MLGRLFHKRKQDEAEELVRDAGFDDIFDALDEEDGKKSDEGEGDDEGDYAFGEGELGLCKILLAVEIVVFVCFENFVEDGVLRSRIEPYETEYLSARSSHSQWRIRLHAKSNNQQNRGDLADSKHIVLQHFLSKLVMPNCYRNSRALECGVVRARDQKAKASDAEQPGSYFADGGMELLACLAQAADVEAGTQTQQQVGQDGSQDGGLDDGNEISMFGRAVGRVVLDDEDEEQDDLDYGAKGSLDQDARYLGHLARKLLPCEAQQVGDGHHSDVAECEDEERQAGGGIVQHNGDGHEGPEEIDIFGDIRAAAPGDVEEVAKLEAAAAALAVRVDVVGEELVEEGSGFRRRHDCVAEGRIEGHRRSMAWNRRPVRWLTVGRC